MCRKVSYPSREAAMAAKNRIDRKKGRLLHPYICQTCKRWHLGNNQYTRLENINRVFDRLPVTDRAVFP